MDPYHYFLQNEGPAALADYYGYDEWSNASGLSFHPSAEQAAADSADRHAAEDWEVRSYGYPSQETIQFSEPLPF